MGFNKSKAEGIGLVFLLSVSAIAIGSFAFLYASSKLVSCNKPASLEQCGITKCNIDGVNNVRSCIVTVTFPKAFSSNPTYEGATWISFNGNSNHPERNIPGSSITFQADNGETWVSMPATRTELYGNTNHEPAVDASLVQQVGTATFSATCLVSGTGTTEMLRPEFWNSNTLAWEEASANTGFLDIDVSSNGCGFSSPTVVISQNSALNSDIKFATAFRVTGIGGSGVGDNPQFNNIILNLFTFTLQTPSICVAGVTPPITGTGCPIGLFPANPKTQMIILATINFTPFSGFEIDINWLAQE